MIKFLILVIFTASISGVSAMDLEYLRKNYAKAVTDETLCKSIIDKLTTSAESYVEIAYLGAFKTIWANHTFNPVSKLNTFKSGKTLLETAVKKEPNNVEVRFLRLSVQKNCPAFLGYNGDITSDKKFLKTNLGTITSEELKKMVKKLIES